MIAIKNKIRAAKEFAPVERINRDSKLCEDINLSSLDMAELTVKIIDKFDINE